MGGGGISERRRSSCFSIETAPWRQIGTRPSVNKMMIYLWSTLTWITLYNIYFALKPLWPSDTIWYHRSLSVVACNFIEPMMTYSLYCWDHWGKIKFSLNQNEKNMQNEGHFMCETNCLRRVGRFINHWFLCCWQLHLLPLTILLWCFFIFDNV